jgi:hypothetical protein
VKKNVVATLVGMSLLITEGHGGAKPEVTLTVSTETKGPAENLTIDQHGGSVSLVISASAAGGFDGTVSGSITVAEPVNGNHVQLAEGWQSETYPFTLGPGDSTPSRCTAPVKNCFTVATSGNNDRTGTIFLNVILNPSKDYSLNSMSVRQLTITVK